MIIIMIKKSRRRRREKRDEGEKETRQGIYIFRKVDKCDSKVFHYISFFSFEKTKISYIPFTSIWDKERMKESNK